MTARSLTEIINSCSCPNPRAVLGGTCERCGHPYITQRDFPGHRPWTPPRQPALVRHRSVLLVLLILSATLDALSFLTAMTMGEWITAGATFALFCLICWAFTVVRDFRA